MLSPRIRRLKFDYDLLQKRFAGWPLVRMAGTAGMPPELYRFQYLIKGLYVAGGQILERSEHLLEVNLSLGYPRRAPQCRMLTPVFHPNFDDSSVCIGDFWAASEGLDDLIIRIGRMIAYQEYNTKSPLNGLAAKWAAQNAHLLPVDPRPIAPPLDDVAAKVNVAAAAAQQSAPSIAQPTAPAATTPSIAQAAASLTPPQSASSPTDGGDPWEQKIIIT
jgi:ubiquitin-protein ligase